MPSPCNAHNSAYLALVERVRQAHPWLDLDLYLHRGQEERAKAMGDRRALDRAWALARAFQAEPSAGEKQEGVVYTPLELAQVSARWVLDGLEGQAFKPGPILDPAVGGGSLLLACVQHLHQEEGAAATLNGGKLCWAGCELWGVDIEFAAVLQTRLVLATALELDRHPQGAAMLRALDEQIVHGDSLELSGAKAIDWLNPGQFQTIIANPPFRRAARRSPRRADYRCARGAYDEYVLFFERSVGWLMPGGRALMISSNAFMVADYGAALRRLLLEKTRLRLVLDLRQARPFAALVDAAICLFEQPAAQAPMFLAYAKTEDYYREAKALIGMVPGEVHQGAIEAECFAHPPWPLGAIWPSQLLGRRRAIAEQMRRSNRTLGEAIELRTGVMGFHYQGVLAELEEAGESPKGIKALTPGLVRPLRSSWGTKPVRLAKKTWRAPVLRQQPAPLTQSTWAWFGQAKLIISGIAQRITAMVDEAGEYAPLVAVHGAAMAPAPAKSMALLLMSAPIQWLFHQEWAAAQIPRGSRRYSVNALKGIPLPGDWPNGFEEGMLPSSPSTNSQQAFDRQVAQAFGLNEAALRLIWRDLEAMGIDLF